MLNLRKFKNSKMKKHMKILFVFIVSIFLVSCKNNNKKEINKVNEVKYVFDKNYIFNGEFHWKENDENNKVKHTFENDICIECGMYHNNTLFEIFGEDTIIYTNNNNPYNINIEQYANNINVVFYEPDLKKNKDNYQYVDENKFYNNNYKISLTYEDSYYRSLHGLLSGEYKENNHLPEEGGIKINNTYVRLNQATYVMDTKGNFLGYFTNSKNNKSRPLWICGAYISMNDVAAYLLAFAKVPPNSNYDSKTGREQATKRWGQCGRVNISPFRNSDKFKYEPKLPLIKEGVKYIETDFGSDDEYQNGKIKQTPYIHKGNIIARGASRFIFVSDEKKKKIDDRYVFYTYNHYNDFQEYLNYDGGYGKMFGNVSAGNPIISSNNEYKSTYKKPTEYPKVVLKSMQDIIFN